VTVTIAAIRPRFLGFARACWLLLRDAAIGWREDKAMRLGAAIAYYAIFSMGPLLLLVIVVAGSVFGREAAQHQIIDTLRQYIGTAGARTVEEAIVSAQRGSGSLVAVMVGIGVLVFATAGLLAQLEDALNTVWNVEPLRRGFWRTLFTRLVSFTLVLGMGFVMLVSLVVTAGLAAVERAIGSRIPGGPFALEIVHGALSFVVITALFTLIFEVLPDVKIRWRDAAVGAAFTALLFIVGQQLLGLYVRTVDIESSHGAAGSLIVVLVWVYYSCQILFFGAEVTQAYTTRHGGGVTLKKRARPPDDVPSRQRGAPLHAGAQAD
jgi:membrane protein